jgi:hypothetical protein
MRTPIGVATWLLYLLPHPDVFPGAKPWLPLCWRSWRRAHRGRLVRISAGTSSDIAQVNRGMGMVCHLGTAAWRATRWPRASSCGAGLDAHGARTVADAWWASSRWLAWRSACSSS